MDQDPITSVIMPFLDTPEEFLEEAVGSVMAQTDTRWELLLVDDGSADVTANAAQRLAGIDPVRIKYFEHEGHANRGASASRNLGIRHSRGKYIGFLDADDVWLPSKIKEQVALMEAHPRVGMLYGNTEYWFSWTGLDEDYGRDYTPRLGVRPGSVIEPPGLLVKFLRGDAAVPCPTSTMVRKEILNRVGGFHEGFRRVYTDQVFFARVCLETPVLVSGECWDRYRQWRDASCSSAERTGEMQLAREAYLRWLSGHLSERGIAHRNLNRALKEQLAYLGPSGAFSIPKTFRYLRRRIRKLHRRFFGIID